MLNLGTTSVNHTPLRWENAPNNHIFITGQSGAGKSFFLRNLILQLLHQGKARCIVLDASHDLAGGLPTSPGLSSDDTKQISVVDVKSDDFILNPLRLQPLRDGVDEDSNAAANRVAEMLRSAYQLRDIQASYLANHLCDYLEHHGGVGSIPDFLKYADAFLEKDERKLIALSIERMKNFAHTVHCGAGSFDWQLDTPGVTVIDFSRVPTGREQRLLVELSLADIWGQRLRKQDAQIPTVIVLDECQRFKFASDNYTTNLLREGRKYQMSGWFASQWIKDDETLAALEQAALRAYFRPEPSNVHTLAKRLAAGDNNLTKTYERHLSRLRAGQILYHDLNGRPIIANVQAGN